MTAMTRHGRNRPHEHYLWHTILGALIGCVIGVWAFVIIWEAIR